MTTAVQSPASAMPYGLPDFDHTEPHVTTATDEARAGAKALEWIFRDFVEHDAPHHQAGLVTVGGEVFAPVGSLPANLAHFLTWAEAEGLVTVTPKGLALAGWGMSHLPHTAI
jgi:hypothetical protein